MPLRPKLWGANLAFLLALSLFLGSCASMRVSSRNLANSKPPLKQQSHSQCAQSLNNLNSSQNEWNEEAIRRSDESAETRKAFIEHIHFSYPEQLRKLVGDLAIRVNGFEHEEIYFRFFQELETAKLRYARFLNSLKRSPPTQRASQRNWVYLYADQFGVDSNGKPRSFRELTEYLDYWKDDLSADVLYFLPITKSPKKDGGYDVSDYKKVIDEMGGNEAFFEFTRKAREKGINIVMDFVPGHISVEHEWVQKALAGDPKYINRLIHSREPPPSRTLPPDPQTGNVYVEYQGPDGPYRRMLLLPDVVKGHWQTHKLVDGSEMAFENSFFSFQKNLNLQSADVLGEHFSTLGHWISNGVGGIRADAIPWWVKPVGTEGVHSDETFAVSELFYTFITQLKTEDPIYLPELVDAIETGARYVGPEVIRNGKRAPKLANSLFNFEKVVHVLYAGIEGDFSAHFEYLKRYRAIDFPEGYEEVLYVGNHHDEIYLGFLPDGPKQAFQNRIQEAGGVVYKGGNSGGAMVADLLEQDLVKQEAFFKWVYGHYGSKAMYQGMELGATNSWRVAYKQTRVILNELIDSGELAADSNVVRELDEILASEELSQRALPKSSELYQYIDGRLLHRNPVLKSQIEAARRGDNPLFESFQFLTNSQINLPAFARGGVEEELNTWDNSIGSFMRRARTKDGEIEQEIAVVKNGTDSARSARLSLQDLTQKTKFSLSNIAPEGKTPINYKLNASEGYVEIELQPYETLWLEVE